VLIPTTAQQLDTKIYNHTTHILHVAAFSPIFWEILKKVWGEGCQLCHGCAIVEI